MRVDCPLFCVELGHLFLAAFKPADSTLARLLRIFILGRILNAFVKRHCNGRTEIGLNCYAFLRTHKNASAVNVGSKGYTLLGNFAKSGKRENLKAAAVGKNRTVPACEFMQTSHIGNKLVARSDVKMIGV